MVTPENSHLGNAKENLPENRPSSGKLRYTQAPPHHPAGPCLDHFPFLELGEGEGADSAGKHGADGWLVEPLRQSLAKEGFAVIMENLQTRDEPSRRRE